MARQGLQPPTDAIYYQRVNPMTQITGSAEQVQLWLKLLVPCVLVVLLLVFWGAQIATVVSPFLIAFLLAYIFDPVVNILEGRSRTRYRIPRFLAVSLLFIGLAFLALGVCAMVARVVEEIFLFAQRIPDYSLKLFSLAQTFFLDQMERIPEAYKQQLRQQLTPENLRRLLEQYVLPQLQGTDLAGGVGTAVQGLGDFVRVASQVLVGGLRRILGGASTLVNLVGLVLLVLVITFYLLLDFHRLLNRLSRLVPEAYQEATARVCRRIDRQLSGFLRGQLAVCVVVGALVSAGLWMIGVEYAVVIGLVAGVCNIIPYLGPVMGALPAIVVTVLDEYRPALAAATEGQAQGTDWGHLAVRLALVVAVFGIVQLLDGLLVSPRIMGKALELHPMVILFALLLGGALFGLIGMLLAVPVACVVRVLVEEIYFPAGSPSAVQTPGAER